MKNRHTKYLYRHLITCHIIIFMAIIIDYFENIREFSNYVIFSDGAASQFKQRFTLSGIALLEKSLSWNFFAASHGKGAVDGIGGQIET